MDAIKITLDDSGRAYLRLSDAEVRESVSLDELEQAGSIPALGSIVLDFDHYGRLAGIEIVNAADSVLPPALLDGADRT
jgi:uncharacterized protein YuzE